MINAIIGASGDMGNLLVPLLKKLSPVRTVSRNSSIAEWEEIWKSDIIWLSIPRDEIPKVLQGHKFRNNQLIIDICSIKRRLSEVITQTGAAHLSLHPLHGPRIPLNGQKWAIIDSEDNVTHNNKIIIHNFLKDQGISFLHTKSEDEHDFMMGIVLSMPELFTLVMDFLIEQYANDCGQKKPTIEEIMKWAVPASNALFSAYIHAINSSAEWLRADLISGAHGNLIASARNAFSKLDNITGQQITKKIEEQHANICNMPKIVRERVRQWIERWFIDSTQKIFSFKEHKSMKPKLNIQYKKSIEEIFPTKRGKVSVGIHGILGCFTYESAIRLAEELEINHGDLEFKYLIEARNVIEAVVSGEVEIGIFAMANSGSGAYISSMQAMGQYNFEILAIYGMEILQCLMAHPNIKEIRGIKEVFGHPQAISQCKRTFAEKYPDIILKEGEDSDDTALCAKRISQGAFPLTTATLASQEAAKLYGLNILEYGMHHDPFNTTTFLVIKRKHNNFSE